MYTADQVANALREMGRYYEYVERSYHRARAYERAANAIAALGDRLPGLVEAGRLTEVPGLGEKLAHVVAALHTTGTTSSLAKLRQTFPTQLLQLADRRGFTIARLRAIHDALGVVDVEGVKQAIANGSLRGIKGFTPKVEDLLRESLLVGEEAERTVLLVAAFAHSDDLLQRFAAINTVIHAEAAGQIRRRMEMVDEFTFVLASARPEYVLDQVADIPALGAEIDRSAHEIRMQHATGLPVTVLVVPPERFGTTLLFATGSEAHVNALAARAHAAGVTLPDSRFASEAALYEALGLPFIPPEVRDDDGEIAAAAGGDDFRDLITLDDLQGAVHCHTTHSDGKNTIREMAEATRAAGLRYITITDHSTSAPYAGGLTPDRLAAQAREIKQVQQDVEVALLAGTESDITEEGNLDYPLSMLRDLDVVVASIHNRFRLDSHQMTRRLISALTQPVFKIWGHPLGRLLGQRPPIGCDVEAVLDAAANAPCAVEINGSPHRLDLEPRLLKQARKRGLRFVISADAHSVRELDYLRFGVMMARRAGLRRSEVLNAEDEVAFRQSVQP